MNIFILYLEKSYYINKQILETETIMLKHGFLLITIYYEIMKKILKMLKMVLLLLLQIL